MSAPGALDSDSKQVNIVSSQKSVAEKRML
jgi:hypothetical protein